MMTMLHTATDKIAQRHEKTTAQQLPGATRSDMLQADTRGKPRTAKIHMHPVKRRLLCVLALGSVLGCVLMMVTMRFVGGAMHQWQYQPQEGDTKIHFQRLQAEIHQLHDATLASAEQVKLFLHQIQKIHAAATTRTALVEKAAAQSYREHARERLHSHFMGIKEGILLQTSQRRRIDDAAHELSTGSLHLPRQYADASGGGGSHDLINVTSASSSLAQSIRSIRLAMLLEGEPIDARNGSMDASRQQPQTPVVVAPLLYHDQARTNDGIAVYFTVFGVVGVWLWSVVTDERTRKKSVVFHTHRAIWRALRRIIVIERIDDVADDDFIKNRR